MAVRMGGVEQSFQTTHRANVLRLLEAKVKGMSEVNSHFHVSTTVSAIHDLAGEVDKIGKLVQMADGDVDAALSAAGAVLGTSYDAVLARHGISFRDELIQQFPPKSPTDKKQDFIEEPPLRVSLV